MVRTSFANRLYSQALRDVPGVGSPAGAAQTFLDAVSSPQSAAGRVRRRYALYCSMLGFTCGLPGYVSAPVTVPTNIAGVFMLQLHMCAVIAVLGGRDPEDDEIREQSVQFVMDPSTDELESTGWTGLARRVGTKIGERGVRFATEQAVRWIGRRTRTLPLVGGVVGGYSDLRSTQAVGRLATQHFLPEQK